MIWETNESLGVERTGPSGPTFLDWRERAQSFDEMALFQPGSATITGLDEPEQVPAMRVTVNFLAMLGYEPTIGRGFLEEEGRGGRAPSAIATNGFWQRAYGVDLATIGDEFMADHIPYTLVRGRMFADSDNRDHQRVLLVDTAFADAYFPGANVVGEQVGVWGDTFEIVGVVGAVRNTGLSDKPRPTIYLHSLQSADNMMTFVLRVRGDGEGLVEAAKQAVWNVDPDQPEFNIRRMEAVVAQGSSLQQLTLTLLSLFGAVALIMAALGVYGVMSYAVGQRTQEMGLRQALGAGSQRLLAMVVKDAMRLAVAGVAVGIVAAIVVVRALSSLLYGVSATQPLVFVTVTAVLLAVAAMAALLPARRAAGVDPMIALRAD